MVVSSWQFRRALVSLWLNAIRCGNLQHSRNSDRYCSSPIWNEGLSMLPEARVNGGFTHIGSYLEWRVERRLIACSLDFNTAPWMEARALPTQNTCTCQGCDRMCGLVHRDLRMQRCQPDTIRCLNIGWLHGNYFGPLRNRHFQLLRAHEH